MNVSRRCKRCGRTRTIGNADTRTIERESRTIGNARAVTLAQGGSAPLTSLTESFGLLLTRPPRRGIVDAHRVQASEIASLTIPGFSVIAGDCRLLMPAQVRST
jgi:hypothetical protein